MAVHIILCWLYFLNSHSGTFVHAFCVCSLSLSSCYLYGYFYFCEVACCVCVFSTFTCDITNKCESMGGLRGISHRFYEYGWALVLAVFKFVPS